MSSQVEVETFTGSDPEVTYSECGVGTRLSTELYISQGTAVQG